MTFSLKLQTKVILFALNYFAWTIIFYPPLNAQTPIDVAGTANKTATASGDWTNTATWGGSLPTTEARILIPNGITVTVDAEIPTEFKSIRINGTLKFANDVDTELRAEYMVSSMSGQLEIGTAANPIASNRTAKLVFSERGGTTSSFDPERFAPGAVLMGPTTMHGTNKTSWLSLQTHPSAGATQFVLNSTPTGWQIGDKIVVAGTDPITNASITNPVEFEKDEVVTITGVAGNVVTFTPALVRDHKAPSQAPDLEVHVANLSRNIVISSANTSVTSISGDFRKPRGHLMFMHNLDVDIKYVEANNLGRTDKSITLDDWDFEDLDRSPSTGSPVPNGKRNPRGRYSFHFHRGGLDVSVFPARPITPLPNPAVVEGCVVNTDPGWGYVNHSSRVNFIRNVSYNVVGGAFNTEAGNETGSFIENIAIRTVNPQNPIMIAPRPRDSYTQGGPTSSLADLKENRQDFAWQGDGFWLHGTGVTVSGNVVASCTGHAYVYWVDGLIEKGMGMARGDIDAHVPAAEFPTQNQLLHDWKATYPNFFLDIWYLQARPFTNNTAYNFARGVQTYYIHTELHRTIDPNEDDPNGRFNDLPDAYKDQLDLVLDGTILWNIGRVGFEHNHTANVTIQNSRIVGYGARTGFENYGTNPAPDYISEEPEVIGLDLDYYFNTHRWTLNNNTVEGFSGNSIGITLPINAQVTMNGGTFNNEGIDILIGSPGDKLGVNEEGDGFGIGMLSTDPVQSEILIQGNIVFQNPNNNIVMDAQIIYDRVDQKGFPLLGGIRNDDLYFILPQEVTFNFGPFDNVTAYFDEQDANYIPLTNENACDFSDGGAFCTEPEFIDQTNAELDTEFGTSYLDAITPNTAVTHPMLIGGKVDGAITLPVELLTFEGTVVKKGVNQLDWRVASETDFSHYEIERSEEGSFFSKIGTVASKGTTSKFEKSYQYIDNQTENIKYYYRLKMMDINGSFSYSNVIVLNDSKADSEWIHSIYPNPTTGHFTITGDFENYTIQILSSNGTIYRELVSQNSPVEMDISALPPGIYLVKIIGKTSGRISLKRIVKMGF